MIIGNRKYRKLSASETVEANDVYARSNEPQCVHIDQVGYIIPTNCDDDYYRPIGFKFERKLASDEILVALDEYRRIETNGHVKVERVAPGLIGKPASQGIHRTQSAYWRSTDADCLVIKGKKYRRLERHDTVGTDDVFISNDKFEHVELLAVGANVGVSFGYLFRPASTVHSIQYNGRNYWCLAPDDILRDGDRIITADRNEALHPALIGCRVGPNRFYFRADYVSKVIHGEYHRKLDAGEILQADDMVLVNAEPAIWQPISQQIFGQPVAPGCAKNFFRKIKTNKPMVNILEIKKAGEQQSLRTAIADRFQIIDNKVQAVRSNLATDTTRATAATDIKILSDEILVLITELER